MWWCSPGPGITPAVPPGAGITPEVPPGAGITLDRWNGGGRGGWGFLIASWGYSMT